MDLTQRKIVCDEVVELTDRVATFIRNERECFTLDKIQYKGEQNLVSYVDKTSEKLIVEKLSTIIMDNQKADIIAEEGQYEKTNSRYVWIIDPLDGTTNFIHGLPPYCISIALMHDSEIIIGVIREVTTNDLYCAWGEGFYYNGLKRHVSEVPTLKESLGITGLAYNITPDQQLHFAKMFDYFNKSTHGARRTGSAAMNLAYVARGVADFFYQVNLSPWDVASGAFLVKEAGGVVTDFNKGDNYVFGRQIIATNPYLYDTILNKITE